MMTLLIFAGCKSNKPGSSGSKGSAAPVTVLFMEPGTQPKNYAMVTQKLDEKLKADGLNIKIARKYIPWDTWSQKINLMLSTGENFDIFPIMADITPFSSYYTMNGLSDLTSAINKYGTNLKKYISSSMWDAAKINGKTLIIPADWMECPDGVFDIRKDLLEKNNLSMPTTPDEMFNDVKTVQQNWTGTKKLYMMMQPGYDPLLCHTDIFHRTYASYPFTVEAGLIYVDQKGNVKSWFETPEFKQDCEYMRKAYTMGLINPDILTYTSDQFNADTSIGNYFVLLGTSCGNLAGLQKSNPSATVEDIKTVYFDTDKPYSIPSINKNSVAVSSTSNHVNEAIEFMNWLYSSQKNYDLYYYGIEGQEYTTNGPHDISWILDPNNNNAPDYQDADWMSGNLNFERYDVNNFPANNAALFGPKTNLVVNPAAGFTFDASKVQTQYTNVQTEAQAVMEPIVMGVQDYDTSYSAAIAKMKAAGLDQVVIEYESQFKSYLSSQGK
jgi:putative aldouronate transport system substrate-binding protein